jgi:hypothetical protein
MDLTPAIETMEHSWMRAWVHRDAKALKALTAKNFILLMGAKPAAILDRTSWLEAAGKRWDCASYRFGDMMVRAEGGRRSSPPASSSPPPWTAATGPAPSG